MKEKFLPLTLCLITAAIWGFAFVAQVQGMEYIEPFTLIGIRFFISIIALAPVVLFFERGRTDKAERKRTVIASVAAGVVLFSASTLQQFGIKITASAGLSGFITGLYTVFVPIACYVFFKKKTGINVWIGAVCAVAGLALLCYHPGEGIRFGLGEILLLIGSFLWTAHVVIIDRLGKNVRSLHFSWGQFAVCAVFNLIGAALFEEIVPSGIIAAGVPILYGGLMSVGVAYTLQILGQRGADPTAASVILSTESMFSALGGILILGESMSVGGYIGCVLIFVGVVLAQLTPGALRRKNKT